MSTFQNNNVRQRGYAGSKTSSESMESESGQLFLDDKIKIIPQPYTILSWNVLDDDDYIRSRHSTGGSRRRHGAISDYLAKSRATFICLQGVHLNLVWYLLAQKWTDEYHFNRQIMNSKLASDGKLFLSLFPHSTTDYIYNRTANYTSLWGHSFNQQMWPASCVISNIHLTYTSRRCISQIRTNLQLVNEMKWDTHCIITGDFNGTGEEEEKLMAGWTDCVPLSGPRFSFDPVGNELAKKMYPDLWPTRRHRIYTSPLMCPLRDVWIDQTIMCSDHFPIRARFTTRREIQILLDEFIHVSSLVDIVTDYS